MRVHDLKTWPEFYDALLAGSKNFELRNDDRGFEVGDELCLREWNPRTEQYSGRKTARMVSYILEHHPDAGCAATFGLRPGYVILGLSALMGGAAAEIERLRAALTPFAGDKMPGLQKSEIDFDRNGLRRCISPMEIACRDAHRALTPPDGGA